MTKLSNQRQSPVLADTHSTTCSTELDRQEVRAQSVPLLTLSLFVVLGRPRSCSHLSRRSVELDLWFLCWWWTRSVSQNWTTSLTCVVSSPHTGPDVLHVMRRQLTSCHGSRSREFVSFIINTSPVSLQITMSSSSANLQIIMMRQKVLTTLLVLFPTDRGDGTKQLLV